MFNVFALVFALVAMLACSGPRGGGGGGVELDAAALDAPAPDAPAPQWGGTYDATISTTLTTGSQTRTTSDSEAIATTASGARWTWNRPGPCVLMWSLSGATARADAGQRCTVDAGGTPVTIALQSGEASVNGDTVTATLRWTLDAGQLAETITARRRPGG